MAVLGQAEKEIEEIPVEEEDLQKAGEKVYVAPPWKLMWWRFRKHKMALICAVVLIVFYFVAIFCEFVAPYDPDQSTAPVQASAADRDSHPRRGRAISLPIRLPAQTRDGSPDAPDHQYRRHQYSLSHRVLCAWF